jgi:peptidyl-dipeptidase Dcp
MMQHVAGEEHLLKPLRISMTHGALIALGCSSLCLAPSSFSAPAPFGPANPFYAPSALPFQAPPFDKIKDGDYQPAIVAGMLQQRAEIEAITANPSKPTFDNTLLPLERSGQLLERASEAFNAVSEANTNPVLQKIKAELAPKFAAHHDEIFLNAALFARVAAVHAARDSLRLDPESRRLVEYTYDEFVRSGANLSAADKTQLRKLNAEASTLSDTFTTKLLAATKAAAFHTTSRAALSGLSDARLAGAQADAKSRGMDGYVLAMQNTTQQPDFLVLQDRATRQTIFESSWGRSERGDDDDTRALIARLAQLRAARARLLGFKDHAAWKLGNQMARTPEAAIAFMDALVPVATAKALREGAEIQAQIDAQHLGFSVEAWDWQFFGEQVRKAKYSLDDAQIKPYFELSNVLLNGVFYAANQLYGITFKERTDIPVYHPDVRVFEVSDVNGKPLALFYGDYFKRDNKNGGAWMSNFVAESTLLGTLPVIYNVANLPKPAAGEPALISYDDVRTMFHEFGHALHGMFANTRYPSLSGTATARDFVEFPSQFNEHWAIYPAVFNHFAKHYKTGEVMPPQLVEKIAKAEYFDEGYRLTELLAAAELDMQWHVLAPDAPLQNPDEFEKQALQRIHIDLKAVPPRYRSTYFSHIWGGGYSAGYYAYLWTQMLDDDAYEWFDDHGGLTRANGDRFRQMVLSRGNTEDLGVMYQAWRGKAPSIDAMMKYRELTPGAATH